MTKLAVDVRPFIHRHLRVTVADVRAFALASHQTQVSVLAELRSRVHDQSGTVEVALGASALAFISLYLVPDSLIPESAPWGAKLVIGLGVGVGAALVLLPVFIGPYLRTTKLAVAAVWLTAYEDELARRWLDTGHSARRWKREHSG